MSKLEDGNDSIPVLPAMPVQAKRRQIRKYYTAASIVIVGVSCLVIAGLVIFHQFRQRHLADEAFQSSLDLMDQAAYRDAELQLEEFGRSYPADRRLDESKSLILFSKLAQSMSNVSVNTKTLHDELDRLQRESTEHDTVIARWHMIMTLAERAIDHWIDKTEESPSRSAAETTALWASWIGRQKDKQAPGSDAMQLDSVLERLATIQTQLARTEARENLIRKIQSTTENPTPNALQALQSQCDELKLNDPEVTTLLTQCREALAKSVSFKSRPEFGSIGPSLNPIDLPSHTLLSTHRATTNEGSQDLVWVQSKNLCMGLDTSTGQPKWVYDIGYDGNVPVQAQQFWLFNWSDNGRQTLSASPSDTMESLWSWQPPTRIVSPPAYVKNRLFVLLDSGELAALRLKDGSVIGVADLKDVTPRHLAVNEDRSGLVVVADEAIYLVRIQQEALEIVDIIPRHSDSSHWTEPVWVDPYVVLFENTLNGECIVRVYRNSEDFHRLIDDGRVRIRGHLWQPPILDGPRLFFVTDTWHEYCLGLNPGASENPVFTAGRSTHHPDSLPQPIIPSFAGNHPHPLLTQSDAMRLFKFDQSNAEPLLVPVWEQASTPNSVPSQRLQVRRENVIFTEQSTDSDSVIATALNKASGTFAWQWKSEGHVSQWIDADEKGSVVLKTSSGRSFHLTKNESTLTANPIDLPLSTHRLNHQESLNQLLWLSEDRTLIHRADLATLNSIDAIPCNPRASSDISLWNSEIRLPENTVLPGPWVTYLTGDAIEVKSLTDADLIVAKSDLPLTKDSSPWRFAPLSTESSLIAVHSSGTLCRYEPRRSQEITYLQRLESRGDLPPLDLQPVLWKGAILCRTEKGRLMLIDPQSLDSVSSFETNSVGAAQFWTDQDRIYTVTNTHKVVAVELADSRLTVAWERPLEEGEWHVVMVEQDYVLLHSPDGRLLSLDSRNGQTAWEQSVGSALTTTPLWIDDHLLTPLVNGGITLHRFLARQSGQ